MNYLKVPDSNIKLTDGSVVMLARFPGTKWVVHYGWYDYSGRREMGWYFSSIPAQTVIPVTNQDLQLIVLLEQGTNPDIPAPPSPPSPPTPGPHPGPWPPQPGPWPPKPGPQPPFVPGPDSGLYPVPPGPVPPPGDPRAFFSKNDQYLLDSSWISLPSIKYRDALHTVCNIPDGKIVKINNVDGVTRYYCWNAPDQRWDEKFYENDAEKLLVNYYDKEEIDAIVAEIDRTLAALEAADVTINDKIDTAVQGLQDLISAEATTRAEADEAEAAERIAAVSSEAAARQEADDIEADARAAADAAITDSVTELSGRVEEYFSGLDARFDALIAADEELAGNLQALHNFVDSELESLKDRVTALEAAVFNIRTIVATSDNTVLVSDHGTLKDSGVNIGDDEIGESSTYASATTLATEKAVVKLVDDNATQWSSF